jgi:hypothetical protein
MNEMENGGPNLPSGVARGNQARRRLAADWGSGRGLASRRRVCGVGGYIAERAR